MSDTPPLRGRSSQFVEGYRCAMKRAITWLHRRAEAMGDPHARDVLHSAATNLGWDDLQPSNLHTSDGADLALLQRYADCFRLIGGTNARNVIDDAVAELKRRRAQDEQRED
ncbi:hypothetical protein [Consotaella aegiceratis]|uniref:hypothetical protein n=1 Tax=Consotaella aegiceratis TaxID=3097961 RepID=UPI002F428662